MNVLVYLAMGISGASWADPSFPDIVRWGADYGPLTMSGEWWRLFTCTFVHIGFIHIALNMWCLWDLGPVLERLMGWKAFLVTYVVTGIAASEVSLAWRPDGGGAGASGAVFGVAGAFFSFLLLKKAPLSTELTKRLRKSLSAFIFYNLFFGLVALRVDNAAHIGGLVTGLILGAVIPCAFRQILKPSEQNLSIPDGSALGDDTVEQTSMLRLATITIASVLVLFAAGAAIRRHNAAIAEYGNAVRMIRAGQASEAIPYLQNAITRDPKYRNAHEMLGILLLDRNQPDVAIKVLDDAVRLDPNNLDLRHNFALALVGNGYCDDAAQEIAWAMKSRDEDKSAADFIQGLASYCQANPDQSSKNLLSAIQNRKNFFEAQNALARVYINENKRDEARVLYEAVLAEHPKDSVAMYGLEFLDAAQTTQRPQDFPPIVIPYSKLTAKSQMWPLLP
jgi:membrane associated rhomboid family serine protease/Tfp pilus assembly protein PilF